MLTDNAVNPLIDAAHGHRFMTRYWQRRPAVIRNALQTLPATIDRRKLFALACDDDVESRLIRRRGRRWTLDHGPFTAAEELPATKARQWTLLVQSVNHHDDAAAELVHSFRFIPDVRIDDLMVSIAGDGGGVGPHDDSYDVFLLQLDGSRRWQLGEPGHHCLQADQPLRLIADFEPQSTVELNPGDMLYVPPGWIHDGVAIGECITASIGFRSPTRSELLAAWLTDCAERVDEQSPKTTGKPYRDRFDRDELGHWRNTPARMPPVMLETMQTWLQNWRASKQDMQGFIGRYLTEPKPGVWFERPGVAQCRSFERDAKRNGVQLDRRSRCTYRQSELFINGECSKPGRMAHRALSALADARRIDATQCGQIWTHAGDLLGQWHAAGWLHVR